MSEHKTTVMALTVEAGGRGCGILPFSHVNTNISRKTVLGDTSNRGRFTGEHKLPHMQSDMQREGRKGEREE